MTREGRRPSRSAGRAGRTGPARIAQGPGRALDGCHITRLIYTTSARSGWRATRIDVHAVGLGPSGRPCEPRPGARSSVLLLPPTHGGHAGAQIDPHLVEGVVKGGIEAPLRHRDRQRARVSHYEAPGTWPFSPADRFPLEPEGEREQKWLRVGRYVFDSLQVQGAFLCFLERVRRR